MNLGDVSGKTVPKITMVSAPQKGGTISTRTFIPHRCHASIGVLGAVSVATACFMEGTPAYELAERSAGEKVLARIEHPLGENQILLEIGPSGTSGTVEKASVIRTARKLFDGKAFG